jgi:hypothetical protein
VLDKKKAKKYVQTYRVRGYKGVFLPEGEG